MTFTPKLSVKDQAHRTLLGPGPSNVHPRVLEAMSQPLLGHLDPDFLAIMDEIQGMLRYVMQTENRITMPMSGTGSSGMETCLVNLIEHGDKVVVATNGVFGMRMQDVAGRAGANVVALDKDWGQAFSLKEIEQVLEREKPAVFCIVHGETSTGVLQPMEGIGELCRAHGALLVVDCVTSLVGTPVRIDDWQIDSAYSGTQKCLSCPPGLAPVTFNERALEKVRARKSKVQSWYLDISMLEKYFGQERVYHHTAPISMNFALHEALKIVCEEGLEKCWQRHETNHKRFREGAESLGMKYSPDPAVILPQLNAVEVPAGIEDGPFRARLLKEQNIEIGGGLGAFKGKVWRVGLMGCSSTPENVDLVLGAVEQGLS